MKPFEDALKQYGSDIDGIKTKMMWLSSARSEVEENGLEGAQEWADFTKHDVEWWKFGTDATQYTYHIAGIECAE